jgi:hypothetical protein
MFTFAIKLNFNVKRVFRCKPHQTPDIKGTRTRETVFCSPWLKAGKFSLLVTFARDKKMLLRYRFPTFQILLFSIDDLTVATWLIQQGLLGRSRQCEKPGCNGDVRVDPWDTPSDVIEAGTTRFPSYSFFERSKLDAKDIMQLIKAYLEGLSLGITSRYAGVSYTGTAVDWGSFIRELMKEYFHVNLSHKKMNGIVGTDESLFGRRVKFHRGDPNKG